MREPDWVGGFPCRGQEAPQRALAVSSCLAPPASSDERGSLGIRSFYGPCDRRTATTRNPMWSYRRSGSNRRRKADRQGQPSSVQRRPGATRESVPSRFLAAVAFAAYRSGSVAAGQLGVVPVPAPLEGVAVHVVEAPGVGRVAADPGRLAQRRPRLAPVVRLALEVRLLAAERVAERRGRRRPGPAGVLPLGLGRQAELPALRQLARPAGPARSASGRTPPPRRS